ncbi:unnamed protein product, partial [Cuscuta campestris]
MVITRSSNTNSNPEDNQENPFGKDPLATIASRLAALDVLQEKVTALEANSSRRNSGKGKQRNRADDSDEEYESSRRASRLPHAKLEFPKFTGGDPRGWVLKAEKYFRYYDVPEDDKVDVASMYLEGDALDLFSWMSTERTLFYWEDLVKAFQEHYGPPEYQNPDEYLCSIKQSGTVTEYRLEFARRASRVERWPEHCLLGVFINGLKEELQPDVRLHKPQTVYRAASLALEFERKQPSSRGSRSNAAFGPNRSNPLYPQNYSTREQKGSILSSSDHQKTLPSSSPSLTTPTRSSFMESERQHRREKGLCFRCGDPFRPGHRCSSSFSLMEIDDEGNPVQEKLDSVEEQEVETLEEAEISFNAILGRPT